MSDPFSKTLAKKSLLWSIIQLAEPSVYYYRGENTKAQKRLKRAANCFKQGGVNVF